MDNLNEDEQTQLIRLLSKCIPGKLSIGVFSAIARLTVSPAVEVIPLRQTEHGVEVLLIERSSRDPVWPLMLHTPGTILRPTDTTLDDGFKRIFNGELVIDIEDTNFIGISFGNGMRGVGVGIEYWS